MDLNAKYFFVTVNFLPDYRGMFTHVEDDLYRHTESGRLYRRRALFDFGWGQEPGYECFPPLSFDKLIQLIELRNIWTPLVLISKRHRILHKLCYDNYTGAVSVIMQDHVDELIQFLEMKLETEYFDDPYIRRQFQRFSFSEEQSVKLGYLPTGIGNTTFAKILDRNPAWRKISEQVIRQVYR